MNPSLLAFSLNFYTSPLDVGLLFARLGKIGGLIGSVNTYRGATVPPAVDTIRAQYNTSLQKEVDSLYANLTSFQNASAGFLSYQRTVARNTLIDTVNAAAPQPNASLNNALIYLVNQMRLTGDSVSPCVVSASAAAAPGNVGNPAVAVSVKTKTGYAAENAFAEAIALSCTSDAASGGATFGREGLIANGRAATSDPLSYLYPAGSGAAVGLTCVDGSASQAGGVQNWLTNGNFETWTVPNVPDGWHVGTGTAGTTVLRSTVAYDGTYSLSFAGDGSELTGVYQAFGVDTSIAITGLDQFAVNCWVSTTGAPASGVLEVALTDGSDVVIADNLGVPNLFTRSLATLGGVYAPVTGIFRTPRVMPATTRLRIRLSTALPVGATACIDRMAFANPTQLYPQGPSLAVFSGSQGLLRNDAFTVAVANGYQGGFQRLFERLFGMRSLGILLPSSASPTISDSLIS